jgi:hypothetical protein
MKTKGKVMIESIKEKTGRTSVANPHAVKDVNQASGPRTGNASAHEGKRATFMSAKAEREPLARVIQDAYGARTQKDYVNPKMEGISPNTPPRKFKK